MNERQMDGRKAIDADDADKRERVLSGRCKIIDVKYKAKIREWTNRMEDSVFLTPPIGMFSEYVHYDFVP
jgi:hypothetical protein